LKRTLFLRIIIAQLLVKKQVSLKKLIFFFPVFLANRFIYAIHIFDSNEQWHAIEISCKYYFKWSRSCCYII